MSKRINREGQTFNDWVVVKYVDTDDLFKARYLCRCKCGYERVRIIENIKNGKSKCCETCSAKKLIKLISNEVPNDLWKKILYRAGLKNYEVSITKEEAYQLFLDQGALCKLSNTPIQFASHTSNYKEQTASLDRIDSNLGYIKGNIQWVHKDINLMKNIFSQGQFIDLCRAVCYHNEKTN